MREKSTPPVQPDAIVLFAHGARDARWSQTLVGLADAIRAAPGAPPEVTIAFLELQQPSLAEALDAAVARGARRIDVLPVFWASGGHIANDLPPLVARFEAAHAGVALRILPVLSELPGMIEFIAAAALRGGR